MIGVSISSWPYIESLPTLIYANVRLHSSTCLNAESLQSSLLHIVPILHRYTVLALN